MIYCKHCYYDLRATAGDVCPECGRGFDRDDPWTFASERTWEMLRYKVLRLAPLLLAVVSLAGLNIGTGSHCSYGISPQVMAISVLLFSALLGGVFAIAARKLDFCVRGLFEILLWVSVFLWIGCFLFPVCLATGCR